MTEDAPPAGPEAPPGTGRALRVAAVDGIAAFVVLLLAGQILAVLMRLLLGAYGLWSWAKIGLLTSLLSFRAEVGVRLEGLSVVGSDIPTLRWRLVPMLLTIGFLWLAARAGRRAARAFGGRSVLSASALAAAGAALPVAALAALAASAVTLDFPTLRLRLDVDASSAALWGGTLSALGAGAGAFLERTGIRLPGAALRGGISGYAWALGFAVVGVVVVLTLEPSAFRSYLDGLEQLGTGGGVFAGAHVLALPAQSALLLVPAGSSCLDFVVAGEAALRLCPWSVAAAGRIGLAFFSGTTSDLSPWMWVLNAVPVLAAGLGGRAAAAGTAGREALARGMSAGAVFAGLVVAGAVFAGPRFSVPIPAGWVPVEMVPRMPGAIAAAMVWGIGGGALGGWLAARRYEEPEPRPTSM